MIGWKKNPAETTKGATFNGRSPTISRTVKNLFIIIIISFLIKKKKNILLSKFDSLTEDEREKGCKYQRSFNDGRLLERTRKYRWKKYIVENKCKVLLRQKK